MDALEFMGMLLVCAGAIGAYVRSEITKTSNASNSSGGARSSESGNGGAKSYQLKPRHAHRAYDTRSVSDVLMRTDARTAYTVKDPNARLLRKYRRQDEARYRVKDRVGVQMKQSREGGR